MEEVLDTGVEEMVAQQEMLVEDQGEDDEVNSDDTEVLHVEEEVRSEVTDVVTGDEEVNSDANVASNEDDTVNSEVLTNQQEMTFENAEIPRNEFVPQNSSLTNTTDNSAEPLQQEEGISNLVKNELRCKICNMKMKNKHHLNGHMRTHKRKKFILLQPVQCKICNQSFRHQFQLNGHMNVHKVKNNSSNRESSSDPPLNVSPSRNLFKTNYRDLNNGPLHRLFTGKSHTSRVIVKRKPEIKSDPHLLPFQCRVCKKICAHRFHLNGHMRSHKEILDKQKLAGSIIPSNSSGMSSSPLAKIMRPKNPISTTNSSILTTLLTNKFKKRRIPRKKYQKNYPYKCSKCSYKSTASLSLELHIRLVHEGIVPYKCDHCWKSFPTQMHLYKHSKEVHVPTKKGQNSNSNKVNLPF